MQQDENMHESDREAMRQWMEEMIKLYKKNKYIKAYSNDTLCLQTVHPFHTLCLGMAAMAKREYNWLIVGGGGGGGGGKLNMRAQIIQREKSSVYMRARVRVWKRACARVNKAW